MATSVSAMVTAPPPGVRPPKPLPGETVANIVIRNYSDEWSIFLENVQAEFPLDRTTLGNMRRGVMPPSVAPRLAERIQSFMNQRLPLQGRTVNAIAELRDHVAMWDQSRAQTPYTICEILIPQQGDTSKADPRQSQMLEAAGARQVHVDSPSPGVIDFNKLLGEVRGDFLWIVGGGTNLFAFEVSRTLAQVLKWFAEEQRLALYSDQAYCMVYRVSALKGLIAAGKQLSTDLRDNGRMLHEAGFEFMPNPDPLHRLAYLERCYGGDAARDEPLASGKPWWKRLFGG